MKPGLTAYGTFVFSCFFLLMGYVFLSGMYALLLRALAAKSRLKLLALLKKKTWNYGKTGVTSGLQVLTDNRDTRLKSFLNGGKYENIEQIGSIKKEHRDLRAEADAIIKLYSRILAVGFVVIVPLIVFAPFKITP